jgi:hypothetical protein
MTRSIFIFQQFLGDSQNPLTTTKQFIRPLHILQTYKKIVDFWKIIQKIDYCEELWMPVFFKWGFKLLTDIMTATYSGICLKCQLKCHLVQSSFSNLFWGTPTNRLTAHNNVIFYIMFYSRHQFVTDTLYRGLIRTHTEANGCIINENGQILHFLIFRVHS